MEYYIEIYDYYGFRIPTDFSDLKDCSKFLNVPLKKLVYSIRHDNYLVFQGHKVKVKIKLYNNECTTRLHK